MWEVWNFFIAMWGQKGPEIRVRVPRAWVRGTYAGPRIPANAIYDANVNVRNSRNFVELIKTMDFKYTNFRLKFQFASHP